MSIVVEKDAERLARRIQELEQENSRLSRELEETKRSEGLYRTLAENLPIGAAFLLDRDLRYVLVEGQALEGPAYPPISLSGGPPGRHSIRGQQTSTSPSTAKCSKGKLLYWNTAITIGII